MLCHNKWELDGAALQVVLTRVVGQWARAVSLVNKVLTSVSGNLKEGGLVGRRMSGSASQAEGPWLTTNVSGEASSVSATGHR